jgi:hypothetical protein
LMLMTSTCFFFFVFFFFHSLLSLLAHRNPSRKLSVLCHLLFYFHRKQST